MYISAKEVLPGVYDVTHKHEELGEISTTVTPDDPETAELRAALFDEEGNLNTDVSRYNPAVHLPEKKNEGADLLAAEKLKRYKTVFGDVDPVQTLSELVRMIAGGNYQEQIEVKAAALDVVSTWHGKHLAKIKKCKSVDKVDQCLTEAINDA